MDYSIEIDEIMIYQFADEQIILHVIYAQPTIYPEQVTRHQPARHTYYITECINDG